MALIWTILYFMFMAALIIAVVGCTSTVVLFISLHAVVLSKIIFSLFVALVLHLNAAPFVEHSFLNFGIWAAICLAICFILCLLPRFNTAYQLFCNHLVSYVICDVLSYLVLCIFTDIELLPIWAEICVKVACLLFSLVTLFAQLREYLMKDISKYKLLVYFDRLLASLLHSITILLLVSFTVNNLWSVSVTAQWIIWGSSFVAAFLIDTFLFHTIHKKLVDNADKLDGIGSSAYTGFGGMFKASFAALKFVFWLMPADDDDYYY